MFPRPTGNYRRAAITAIFTVLLLAAGVAAVFRYATGRGYATYGLYGFPLLVALLAGAGGATFAVVQLVQIERALRAAEHGDELVAPRMLTQPDPKMALRFGERIELVRTMPWDAYQDSG